MDSPILALESPWGGQSDGGLQVFADDVFERRVAVSGTAEEATSIMEKSDKSFDEAMGKRRYCQNVGKRVMVPEFRSPIENRRLQGMVKEGSVVANTRHLGGQYCRTGANTKELDKRIQQINTAWCEMGRFWNSDAPFQAKRCAFIGSVQGAAVSGPTSYVLIASEERRIDS